MTYSKIITHPGPAHLDDVVATSVAIYLHEVDLVERRDPTQEELENPEVLVLDVGRKWNPEKGNFDHHQFSWDQEEAESTGGFLIPEVSCALTLFLEAEGLDEGFLLSYPWYEAVEILDSKGPRALREAYPEKDELMEALHFPIGGATIQLFREEDRLERGEALFSVLEMIGEQLVSGAAALQENLDVVRETASVTKIRGHFVLVSPKVNDTRAINIALKDFESDYEEPFSVTISPDNRAPEGQEAGWSLFRLDDHPGVDFTKVKDHPSVRFAHNNGFLAKTKAIPIQEALEELIPMALS